MSTSFKGKIKKRAYSFPDRMPELAENGKMLKLGNEYGYQGSVFKVEMPGTPFMHYGLFYGYDKKNKLWIIDNTSKGVLVTDYREFSKFGKLKVEYELMKDPEKSDEIIERAKLFVKNRKHFDIRKNNCEIFVNYCYGEIEAPESSQSKIMEIVANFFVSVAENIYLQRSKHDPNKNDGVKKSFDELRRKMELKEALSEPKASE